MMDVAQNSPVQNSKNPFVTPRRAIIAGMLFLAFIIIFFVGVFIRERTKYHQVAFSLHETDSTYQITKCWATNPPSYWIKQLKAGQDKLIQIDHCSFRAVGAIRLKENGLGFNRILDRNVKPEGALIQEKNKIYYLLTTAPLDIEPEIVPTQPPEKKFEIKKVTPNGEEIVFSESVDGDHKIVRWQNYLFFGPMTPNAEYPSSSYNVDKPKLTKYNLTTGKLSTVYADKNDRTALDELKIIDGTLYFSVDGYLTDSNLFWLSSPTAASRKLLDRGKTPGYRIEYEYGRYWIKGGFGDGCGGGSDYSLFNPKTKGIQHIVSTGEGCSEGESFIGVDTTEDRMIVSEHSSQPEGKYPNEQVYQSVAAIPLAKPAQKTFLISPQDMPKNVMAVQYASESAQLALTGESLQLFDLKTLELKKLADFPNGWLGNAIFNWTQDHLCVSSNIFGASQNNTSYYGFILANGSMETNPSYCAEDSATNSQARTAYEQAKAQKIKDLILQLALPVEYTITY